MTSYVTLSGLEALGLLPAKQEDKHGVVFTSQGLDDQRVNIFIHSSNKYLLSFPSLSGTVQVAGDRVMNTTMSLP